MKMNVLTLVAACSLLMLAGCNNRAEELYTPPDVTRSGVSMSTFKPMPQSYQGILPCADCEGIETSLFLSKEGNWVMNQRYLGRKTTFARYGTWARTAEKLTLTESDGTKHYFLAKDDSIEMLNTEGQLIRSSLNYTLKAVRLPLPVTPMTMKGHYRYLADAALFTDCATGKTFTVDSDAVLQNAYLSRSGQHPGQPVLLSLDAHFVLQPAPDSAKLQTVIIPDGKVTFLPRDSCQPEMG